MKMDKEEIKKLAHELGHHIEKLGNDGIEGWEMDPREVISQMMTLSLILEKLAKGNSIPFADVSDINDILGQPVEVLIQSNK